MRWKILTLLALALVATIACADESLSGKRWTLVQIGDEKWTADRPYLEFDRAQSRVSGDAGCNRFSGAFEIKEQSVKIARLVSTRRACADDAANRMESRFLSELEAITRFEIRDGRLVLFAGDAPSLAFTSR